MLSNRIQVHLLFQFFKENTGNTSAEHHVWILTFAQLGCLGWRQMCEVNHQRHHAASSIMTCCWLGSMTTQSSAATTIFKYLTVLLHALQFIFCTKYSLFQLLGATTVSAQHRMVEVIGIVSLGIQVCQGLLKYYGSWKDSRKDVAALCSSVESLSSILDQLEQTLTGNHETKSTISDCIEACRSSIEQLDKKLSKVRSVADPGNFTAKIYGQGLRLLYPFRESTLVKLKEIVADIRSNLALAVDTTHL